MEDSSVKIVCEAGINHNGSIKLAKKLIDVAAKAGCDAVKFQTFIAEEEVTNKSKKYRDMIKKLEFNEEQHKELMKYCKKKKIMFLSTPSEGKSAEMLNRLGVQAFKIGSNDIITLPFLEQIARYKKPIILSRGMATMQEIDEALETIRGQSNNSIILLHCTSNYPAENKDLNLNVIKTLKEDFNIPIGYSDHSKGIDAAVYAVVLGAEVIEKHITLDRNLPGPDQKMSIEPKELIEMVKRIREAEVMLGTGIVIPTKSELNMRKHTRKGIVASRDIQKGEKIYLDNITYKRPMIGIPANRYKEIIGKVAKSKIKKDEYITYRRLK